MIKITSASLLSTHFLAAPRKNFMAITLRNVELNLQSTGVITCTACFNILVAGHGQKPI
jgi:hypothetical protein